jgi:molecular chaperone DnaK (HSP70)
MKFTTHVDFQNAIKFHIVQGERELAKDCRSLAFFELKDLPAKRAGFVKIDVTFKVDANGLLKVYASEKETSQTKLIEITPSYGISQEQVEQMILDAKINAQKDVSNKILIEATIASEKLISNVSELVLIEDKFQLKDQQEINLKIKNLTNAISSKDVEFINDQKNQLEELMNALLV